MSRPRKLKAVPTKLVEETVFPTVTFGGNEFEIHPISDRNDDYAYSDSARFLTLAIPVGSKVFGEFLKLGTDNPAAIDRIQKAQADDEGFSAGLIIDLVGLVSKLDVGTLIDDIADAMPVLAAIACHYTDPDVAAADIKKWAKSPMHPELWKAVIAQMKSDNLLKQISGIQTLLGEFSSQ
jgi:hypothetical protein